MIRCLPLPALFFLGLTMPLSAHSQPPLTPTQALERLLTAEHVQAEWFAPAFLAQVPIGRIEMILAGLRAALGGFQSVQEAAGQFETVFERGTVPTTITLDGQGRIAGLLFGPPRLTGGDPVIQALDDLRALPGRVSLLVLRDGRERAALDPDQPLAVGSAFKLAVLNALRDQVEAGRRSWRDIVELRPQWKSLPGGILQSWPDGTPLTLETLATLMISISDNTATDALIDLAGREAVEAYAPANRPFLTTREAFVLKAPANQDLLDRYRSGDEDVRRAVLREAASRPLPDAGIFEGSPRALDIEWFFSARELCRLVKRSAGLPLFGVNPGLARPDHWARVAFKGGSEPGVLNVTTWLESNDGSRSCVAVTWNDDAPLEETRLFLPASALIEGLQ